jgi:hypothetical protein
MTFASSPCVAFVSYIATIVEVAVDDKGKLRVPRVDIAIDCGTYVNPERDEAPKSVSRRGCEMGVTDDESFDAKALALRPEQLESGRLAETGIAAAKREKRRREFAQITREQLERLSPTTSAATLKVFLFLLLIDWKSPGKPILVAPMAV